MREQWIIHIDFNNCYAQRAKLRDKKLQGYPVAVCGSKEDRHGIVLAKCQIAKKYGIKTGQTIWQAKQLCPGLVVVPPDMDDIIENSKKANAIYAEYSPFVEPYGFDESFIDISGTISLYNNKPYEVAVSLLHDINIKTGMTASIGLSFSKRFAKLGSDLAGINEIVFISKENFKNKIWNLPVQELIFIGPKTTKKLNSMGIFTLGQLAAANPVLLKQRLGVIGVDHWLCANGKDMSKVAPCEYKREIKSISKGCTFRKDLHDMEDVSRVLPYLTQKIAYKLRKEQKKAKSLTVYVVPQTDLFLSGIQEFKRKLDVPTYNFSDISKYSMDMIRPYSFYYPIRKIVICAGDLIDISRGEQLNLFGLSKEREKQEKLEKSFFQLQARFGAASICTAKQLLPNSLPKNDAYTKMKLPDPFFR